MGTRIQLAWLLALLLLPSCAEYYRIHIDGSRMSQVNSLFFIGSKTNPLEDAETDPSVLIAPDKKKDYLYFVQFSPKEENGSLKWHQDVFDPSTSQFKVETSSDGKNVTLSADKSLLQAHAELTLVAVGLGDEWYSHVVDHGTIRLEPEVELLVDTSQFKIRTRR